MRIPRSAVLTLIAALTIMMTQIGNLRAQSCILNRQQVEFSGKLCVRELCTLVHYRLQFVGDRILLYENVSSDQNTIFQLGRSMKMKDANSAWRASVPPGSTYLSSTSAEQQGNNLFLTIDEQWSQSGKLMGHVWRKIGFEFPDCTSCQVILYEFSFDSSERPGFRSTFDKYFCRVSN